MAFKRTNQANYAETDEILKLALHSFRKKGSNYTGQTDRQMVMEQFPAFTSLI